MRKISGLINSIASMLTINENDNEIQPIKPRVRLERSEDSSSFINIKLANSIKRFARISLSFFLKKYVQHDKLTYF